MCTSSDDLVAVAEMAVSHKSAKYVENDSRGELRRIVVDIIRWGDFDHFHATQAFSGNGMDHLQSLAR